MTPQKASLFGDIEMKTAAFLLPGSIKCDKEHP